MTANAQTKTATPLPVLTGAERVAVLLLALGKPRAAKLLKRFDADELKVLTRSASDLRPVTISDLEFLVEEFAQKFSSGVNFVGTAEEVENLLSDVMTEDQIAEVKFDKPVAAEPIWDMVSGLKEDVLRSYLAKEHPQTVALVLVKMDSTAAAKIIAAFPSGIRNDLLCRMLGIKNVSEMAVQAVETALREDLLMSSSRAHTGIADILNRLDRAQTDDVLKTLAEVRPDDAKALKSMLFTFEELTILDQKARTLLFDQVPIERLVLALNGTDATFQAAVLSSLASRSRRMVEAELQGGSTASAREVAEARRAIVDTVLKMMAKGEIELPEPDAFDEITVK